MTGLAQRLAATYPFNKNTSVTLVPLREELTGQVHTSLLVLYAAVAILLSIACFNVANLLVARAAARRREIAIRTSLGAGRAAIVRQLLVESLLLAIAGGLIGVALARWSLDAVVAFAPAELLRVPELVVDRRVLAYALTLSLVTGVVVGLVPAMLVVRRPILVSIRTQRSRGHRVAPHSDKPGRLPGRHDRGAAVRRGPARPNGPCAESRRQRLGSARRSDDGGSAARGPLHPRAGDGHSSATPSMRFARCLASSRRRLQTASPSSAIPEAGRPFTVSARRWSRSTNGRSLSSVS